MRRSLITAVVLVVAMFGPLTNAQAALPGGPLVLMGIDAEDGGVGAHGPLSAYTGVAADILANIGNGGSGILVIGGGKAAGDNVTTWWDALGASVAQPVSHVNGSAIATTPFAGKAMIGIASSQPQTFSGGLTDAENDALATRESDIATFVNEGGGLLGFSQDGLATSYPYLNALGAFSVERGRGDADVTATPDGVALGLDDFSLDVCCWHDAYLSFPSFLNVLVRYADTRPGAIGGKKVLILRPCTDAEMSTTVTGPAAGRVYLDTVDVGAAPTSEPLVKGLGVTLTGTAGPTVHQMQIRLDGTTVASFTTGPFTTTVATPSLGQHTVMFSAINDDLACVKQTTQTFTVVCVGVGVAITRPASGRAYLNDSDIGESGGDAFLLGGPLTVEATSADLPHTAEVSLAVDATPFATDATGNPFSGSFATDPLGPGLHLIAATLREKTAGCQSTALIPVRRSDPKVKAVAEGVYAVTNIPAEPQVHAGGAQVSGDGGTSSIRVLDRSTPVGPIDSIHAVTDKASGSIAPFTSRGDSLVTDVSVNGGLITADVLHAKVRADYDIQALTGAAVDDGSQIVNLVVAGTPVPAAAPNTVIALPGGLGRVVVQETVAITTGYTREITVNMVHAWLTTPTFKGEVIIGSAHAGVSLPGGPFFGPESDLIHRPDDAGSGGDAGDTASSALPLAEGTYGGGMLSSDDTSDFYAFPAGQGDRISVTMLPSTREQVIVGSSPAPALVGPTQPDFDLVLRDPTGAVRDVSSALLLGGEPRHVELNADIPFAPAGVRATWTVEVQRGSATNGFYTIDLRIPPSPLLDQEDGNLPGDASASCADPRALPANGTENDVRAYTGVIRDDDQGDTFSIRADIGQSLAVALKPDATAEGADLDLFLYGPDVANGPTDCTSTIRTSTLGKEPLPKALPDLVALLPVQITGTYVFEVRRINGVANYALEVSVVNDQPTLPDNDARTGMDASDDCASATTIQTGLYQGRLGDLPDNDTDDWYEVSLTAGQDLSVVMKSADPNDLTLSLYRPDCTPQAPDQFTLSGMPLSSPETARIRDATAGLWKLRVQRPSSDGGNYALSVTVTP